MNNVGSGTLKTMARAGRTISLNSGQAYIIPNGDWVVHPGPYTIVQFYDPVGQTWINIDTPFNSPAILSVGDGTNYRLFNPTGTVVGAVVTNGGTANTALNGIWPAGSTGGVTATTTAGGAAPAGTAKFNCIVGGAVSTTVTVTAGGSGYTKPPVVVFSNPAPGGLVATGYATLTAGAVSSVTVTNQGGGYPKGVLPTITFINDPLDTTGSGAAATAALDATNDGKLVAVTMADFGGGYTAVPTITIAGLAGSPAATAIGCFTVTTLPTVAGGTNYGNGAQLLFPGALTAGSNTTTNPKYTINLFNLRDGRATRTTTAGATGAAIIDGGLSQVDVSNLAVLAFTSNGTVPGATTFSGGASGGVVDGSMLLPL